MADRKPELVQVTVNDSVAEILEAFWNQNPSLRVNFATYKLLYPCVR